MKNIFKRFTAVSIFLFSSYIFAMENINVFCVDIDESHVVEIQSKKRKIFTEKTGFTPKKTKCFSLLSPMKNKLIKKIFPLLSCEKELFPEFSIIDHHNTAYTSGHWSFVCPWYANDSVKVDCGHELWSKINEKFYDINNYIGYPADDSDEDDQIKEVWFLEKTWIAAVVAFLHKYIAEILPTTTFELSEEEGMVCRHWATIALPLFSYILNDEKSPFTGTIQQVYGQTVNKNWLESKDAHVWNLLTIQNEDGIESQWLVDPFNKGAIDLAPKLGKLKLTRIHKNGDFNTNKLSRSDVFYDWSRLTKELFNINHSKKTIYDDEKKLQLAAEKFVSNIEQPKSGVYKIGEK